jgi:transcriptional regulator of acetoin/glycerol metabolism
LPRRLVESAPDAAEPATGSLRAMERDVLQRTLEACGGNTSAAARRLGINRSTIYRRIKRPLGRGTAQ